MSKDKNYQNAIKELYSNQKAYIQELPKEIAFLLGDSRKIDYKNERLIFNGIMTENEKNILLKFTSPEYCEDSSKYEGAVNNLFEMSQHHVINNLRYFFNTFLNNIKSSPFDTLTLVNGFIALNEACAILPLLLFLSVIFTFLLNLLLKLGTSDNYLIFRPTVIIIYLVIIFILYHLINHSLFIISFLCFVTIILFLLPCLYRYMNFRYWFSILSIFFVILSIIIILCTNKNSVFCISETIGEWIKNHAVFLVCCLMLVLIIGIKSYREKVYISNKYLTKYILLHYPVVFFAGVIYNIIIYVYLCIIVSNDDMKQVSTLPLLTIWSASLAMWMGPFIWAWIQTFSKDFIDEYYRKTTFQIIANLNNHQVMLGYGELGKGIQTELLERMKKNKIQKEPILDPSDGSTIRYLAKDMVVVDRDDKIFDHVYCDPSFEKIGIAKAKYRYIKSLPQTRLEIKKEELWIPAVIGNFINESIIDYCALGKCKFFIDTIEGYEESIRISKFAHDQQRTRGIITVSDSAQKKFLFPRHSGHGIFLAYPTRQRGISLAEVIYPAMSRWLNERNVPNVLIFTDNLRQIHYIIETILQELKLSNYLDQYLGGPWRTLPYQNEHVDLRITLCSEAEEVIRVCCTNMKEDILHSLDVREWVEIIERCASPECAWPSVKYYIKSRVIVEKPHLMTMENMIKWLKPKVVVINYKKTADILKVLHDWIIAVERHNSLKEYYRPWIWMPKIIVGYQGEEERDVRDWLTYYDTLCSIKCSGGDSYNWQRYPVQSIDCMVDLNKDSREQIAAIAEAMQNKR